MKGIRGSVQPIIREYHYFFNKTLSYNCNRFLRSFPHIDFFMKFPFIVIQLSRILIQGKRAIEIKDMRQDQQPQQQRTDIKNQ